MLHCHNEKLYYHVCCSCTQIEIRPRPTPHGLHVYNLINAQHRSQMMATTQLQTSRFLRHVCTLRLRVSVMNINKLKKACIFISADPRPTDSMQGLSGSMVVVLSS